MELFSQLKSSGLDIGKEIVTFACVENVRSKRVCLSFFPSMHVMFTPVQYISPQNMMMH